MKTHYSQRKEGWKKEGKSHLQHKGDKQAINRAANPSQLQIALKPLDNVFDRAGFFGLTSRFDANFHFKRSKKGQTASVTKLNRACVISKPNK